MSLILVTGAARGIGAAIARTLAQSGFDLIVHARHPSSEAEQVCADIAAMGRAAYLRYADLSDALQLQELFTNIHELGPLHGLVNNAGAISYSGPLRQAPDEAISRDLALNLTAPIQITKYALQRMDRGAVIVNISSVAAASGAPGEYVHYAAAKAGLESFTLGLAKELAPEGIRVNAVSPGTIRTGFHLDPQRPDRVAERIPLGRPGEVEEIAAAVDWFFSPGATYATGSILRVAGGL
ncbi:SDR family NAD(P)-dependent oxidoreductase [Glutamicibacter endophyticus]|uniref:SDR family NAD(P)-dependent oxidoreductase n=1 Tax=Glutamicibacter endophyticus TaxID=1522174 RepID=UPI003AF022EB